MRRYMALATLGLLLAATGSGRGQTPGPTTTTRQKEPAVQKHAKGSFDVKVIPITVADSLDTGGFGRMALDKKFSGDLSGTSVGQMIASGDPSQNMGGYVALEKVTGTLDGRSGTFVMMHNGTMTPAAMEMRITVVPGSGTGQLSGLAGDFTIIFEGKNHHYTFDYTLP